MVLRIDAERVDFYRDNFGVDVRDPEHFDLVLDTSKAAAEEASVDAIVEAFEVCFGSLKSELRWVRSPAESVARLG
jgi:cytidylate kinase